jgi:formylglycine-generating enzyme required for sulfatase activity
MRLMQQTLFWETLWLRTDLRTVWINVWQLSTREELWNAFLQALLTEVHGALPRQQRLAFDWHLFRERVRWRKLAQALAVYSYRVIITVTPILLAALWQGQGDPDASQILAVALDPVTGGAASLVLALWLLVKPAVQAARETVSLDLDEVLERAPYQAQVSALQQIHDDFRRMVRAWVGEQGRLVVFVDDLDRCLPDKIAEVLEALKLFTTTERCVYVIGVDHDVVRDAVRDKYEMEPAEAAEYLEKIVQIPFHLPPLEDDRMAQFVRQDYPDVMTDCPNAPQIFSLGLEPNPRKVKRALNIYRTLLELAEARWYNWDMDHKVRPGLVAKMVVLQSRFRDLHRALSREPGLILGLDAWARGYAAGAGGQPDAPEGGQGPELQALIDRLVPEADRGALAAVLQAGEEHFDDLAGQDAYVYIYLTGAGEEAAMRTRPSREEREALLGGYLPVIEDVVGEILKRGEDEEAQQGITQNYVERLTGVLATAERFSQEERWSANLALNRLEGITPPLSFEPSMVRVPRGPFLMGYLEEDLRMLRETLEGMPYGKVVDMLAEEPQLRDFTQGFVASLQDVLGRYVEEESAMPLSEWAPIPGLWSEATPFVADVPQQVDVRRQRRGREKKHKGWMELDLGPFFVGRFPVTNAEYLSFVEDTGHERPQDWVGNLYPELPNAPVVQVSWHDARAYCAWLSEKTGLIYRLPSEAEWEKAARGMSGQLFPWGNDRLFFYCNTFELGMLTARDSDLSSGLSPYLAADMIGNVWEWTASLAEPYPYDPTGSREVEEEAGARVLRGGSFVDVLGVVRCSSRYGADPELRLRNVGFRVVMTPAEWLPQAPEAEEESA